ncbi:DUF6463 family protein [Brachybacterium sp.]|uniref:DUF6463 family protein n=1 Tax=Brachybacterium sp. TaxID=1891286 RepID=UPI00346214C8
MGTQSYRHARVEPSGSSPPAVRSCRARRLLSAAGWLAVGFGTVHTLAAPLHPGRPRVWAETLSRGPWRTISLEPTDDALRHAEAFWVGPGSFGPPTALLGALFLTGARDGARVPASVAWGTLAWSVALTALLPKSPAWASLPIGPMLLLSRRGHDRGPRG